MYLKQPQRIDGEMCVGVVARGGRKELDCLDGNTKRNIILEGRMKAYKVHKIVLKSLCD